MTKDSMTKEARMPKLPTVMKAIGKAVSFPRASEINTQHASAQLQFFPIQPTQEGLEIHILRHDLQSRAHQSNCFGGTAMRPQKIGVPIDCLRTVGTHRERLAEGVIGLLEHPLALLRLFGVLGTPCVNSAGGGSEL